ncbi:hypothetical protein N7462_006561 [Penicillium macrosclerotiorum]|uniref:uncharacterized protein n=1 Tax=Penicillium macrosclerotiorum TaxID=303699 RepID=UPI0025495994|nr:uncharacterized protein N7462_006561 [Penicillium macrosclerotiorum]KAJ5683396.1 hypothetical protein N7462_006561 [Penicillium macrosclerotiorum]
MSMFLFQASRWQFVSHLVNIIHQLSQQPADLDAKDSERIERKKDNLTRAVETARRHITGPNVFTDTHGDSGLGMLDLTPVSRHDTLLSKRAQATDEPLHVLKDAKIKGIPKAAEVGRDWHIHR